jgi:uncharacterized protein YkwD
MSLRASEFLAEKGRLLAFGLPGSIATENRSPESCPAEPNRRTGRISAQTIDLCVARILTISLLVVAMFSANLIVVHAAPQPASAERALYDAANRERIAQGLAPLRWDNALASAARDHALRMAQRNTLSHQFPGELPLQDRARIVGARFTQIAENVAEGPSADGIHASWMHSPPHRANLLDPELTAIGIGVVATSPRNGSGFGGNGILFAVEDFSQSVANLNLGEQERQVAAILTVRGLQMANFGFGSNNGSGSISTIEEARRTCAGDRGWSGSRPAFIVRYETGDLSRLPQDLEEKVRSGRYRAAVVGACEATGGARGFTQFRVAVLLY